MTARGEGKANLNLLQGLLKLLFVIATWTGGQQVFHRSGTVLQWQKKIWFSANRQKRFRHDCSNFGQHCDSHSPLLVKNGIFVLQANVTWRVAPQISVRICQSFNYVFLFRLVLLNFHLGSKSRRWPFGSLWPPCRLPPPLVAFCKNIHKNNWRCTATILVYIFLTFSPPHQPRDPLLDVFPAFPLHFNNHRRTLREAATLSCGL